MPEYKCMNCLFGMCTFHGFEKPFSCPIQRVAEWEKVEKVQNTEEEKLPDWCKEGEFIYAIPDNGKPFYGKISNMLDDSHALVTIEGKTTIGIFTADAIKQARLRPWTYKEAIGKIVFWKGDYDYQENAAMIVGADTDGDFSLYTVGPVTAEELTKEIYYQPDGSPCGVLEHYENGEWVE